MWFKVNESIIVPLFYRDVTVLKRFTALLEHDATHEAAANALGDDAAFNILRCESVMAIRGIVQSSANYFEFVPQSRS